MTFDERMVARGHEDRIERVIGHLVQNALDATEHGGGRVWVRWPGKGAQALVEVGDNGHGIGPSSFAALQAFQTTKPTGMGIPVLTRVFSMFMNWAGKMSVDSAVMSGHRVNLLFAIVRCGACSAAETTKEAE